MNRVSFKIDDEVFQKLNNILLYKIKTNNKMYTKTDIFIEAINALFNMYMKNNEKL